VRLVSHRVSRRAAPDERERSVVTIRLPSNSVEFKVAPADPKWQAAELSKARRELDMEARDPAETQSAARRLRFLGSEGAAKELVQRFYSLRQPHGWELMFGLVASPYRLQILQAMRTAIGDPQHPITRDFVQTLALLEIQSAGHYKLPAYDASDLEARRTALEAKRVAYQLLVDQYLDEVAAALSGKSGRARALSTEALLTTSPANPTARGRWRQMLNASWDSLPVRTRNELIQHRWNEIGGPEMLPILRRIVNESPNMGQEADKIERGPALRHIYESSPEEGRSLILREILDAKGDIGIQILGMLPDPELPQIEKPILAKLRQGAAREVDFQLIARYGSRRALPQVKAIYSEHVGRWACEPQSAMLRYFLRVDPDFGAGAVADAVRRREFTGCYQMTLSGIGEALQHPAMQRVAIAALDDPAYEVVRDAAEALARYGSPDTEPALWRRLKIFHQTWKGREAQLRFAPGMKSEEMAASGAESALVHAITTGQAWLCGPEKLRSLKELVSLDRQRDIDRMLRQWQEQPIPLSLSWWPVGRFSYWIGYISGESLPALKRKLTQLPSGTHLLVVIDEASYAAHAAEIAQVESTAAGARLVLSVKKKP
jgi:hypothetical protein